jgi:hypothetical protein
MVSCREHSRIEFYETLPRMPTRFYRRLLLYCLDDGSALLEGPAATDEAGTAILPNNESFRMHRA